MPLSSRMMATMAIPACSGELFPHRPWRAARGPSPGHARPRRRSSIALLSPGVLNLSNRGCWPLFPCTPVSTHHRSWRPPRRSPSPPHKAHGRTRHLPRIIPVPSVHRTVDRRALTTPVGEVLVTGHGGPPRWSFLRRSCLLSLPSIYYQSSNLRSMAHN
jgi:hypothetical protein